MKDRYLGKLRVKELGLGCMGMSEFYGAADDAASLRVLERAHELGVDHFDTSDMYGSGHNERLLSRFLAGKKGRVSVATKFGIVREGGSRRIDNTPQYVREACERSLERLGVEVIDLYYIHRLDRRLRIEDTVHALGKLVEAGKVRHIGLSEVSPDELKRAHRVHPIAAIQSEYSLTSRSPESNGLFEACRELGVGFVAYAPLGRGLLSAAIRSPGDLDPTDFRRIAPRFAAENMSSNLELVEALAAEARELGCSPAQLALAWVLKAASFVVPIPGTKREKYLEENLGGARVELTDEGFARLSGIFSPERVKGARYPDGGMREVFETESSS